MDDMIGKKLEEPDYAANFVSHEDAATPSSQPDSQAGDDTQLYNKVSELVRWNGWTLSNDEATAALVELAKRYAERLATERAIAVIDDMYKLSPTKQFKDWTPQDALQFYERLKAYEATLTKEADHA